MYLLMYHQIPDNEQDVIQFYLSKFLDKIEKDDNGYTWKYIYCFVTSSVDTKCIKKVMQYIYNKTIETTNSPMQEALALLSMSQKKQTK